MTKQSQQITFDAMRPAVDGMKAETLAITATAMPTRTDRAKDRDGWRSVKVDGTTYRILIPTGADVEATIKAVVEGLLSNEEFVEART